MVSEGKLGPKSKKIVLMKSAVSLANNPFIKILLIWVVMGALAGVTLGYLTLPLLWMGAYLSWIVYEDYEQDRFIQKSPADLNAAFVRDEFNDLRQFLIKDYQALDESDDPCEQLRLGYRWMARGCLNGSIACNETTIKKIAHAFPLRIQINCRISLELSENVTIGLLPSQIIEDSTTKKIASVAGNNLSAYVCGEKSHVSGQNLLFVEKVMGEGATSEVLGAFSKLEQISENVEKIDAEAEVVV